MFRSIDKLSHFATFALVGAVALSLGGCFAGSSKQVVDADVEIPVATTAALPSTSFVPKLGGVTSTGLVARTTVTPLAALPSGTPAVGFDVFSAASTIQTWANADTGAVGVAPAQKVTTSASGHSGTGQMSGVIENNGGDLYRGNAIGTGGDYIYYTNTPTKALNDSLGATALSYSYIGLGGLGVRGAGNAMESRAIALFGGDRTKTADMPTTGTASYKGAFEGVEQSWAGGSASVVSSRLAGAANMTADFAAASVSGRIDYINRYTPSATGFDKRATDYSIGFKGQIIGNGFEGKSSLNEWGSDKAIGYTTQNGALQGGFFGPKAAEATGALAVSSTHDATKTLVTGAFGAKKQ
jgi:hypothetical protein